MQDRTVSVDQLRRMRFVDAPVVQLQVEESVARVVLVRVDLVRTVEVADRLSRLLGATIEAAAQLEGLITIQAETPVVDEIRKVLLDDLVCDQEAQSGAPGSLRRKEAGERLLLEVVVHPAALIPHLEDDRRTLLAAADLDVAEVKVALAELESQLDSITFVKAFLKHQPVNSYSLTESYKHHYKDAKHGHI